MVSLLRRKLSVLLIEDSDPDVDIIKTGLRDALVDCEIRVVKDGAEAIESFSSQETPDLILLDLSLPKVNGLDVLSSIKGQRRLRRVPVIILSGSNREEDLARSYDLQISAYFVKPVDLNEYFGVVRSIKELWFHHVALPAKEAEAVDGGL